MPLAPWEPPQLLQQLGGTEQNCPHCCPKAVLATHGDRESSGSWDGKMAEASLCSHLHCWKRCQHQTFAQEIPEESLLDLGIVRIRALQMKTSCCPRKIGFPCMVPRQHVVPHPASALGSGSHSYLGSRWLRKELPPLDCPGSRVLGELGHW